MKLPGRGRSAIDRLLDHLVADSELHPMADELRGWLTGSSRFRAFVDTHRDKVRKKLRTAADCEALLDVRAELRVAHLLLADRRLGLDFEAFGSATGGPDFTVRLASERPMNLEVTRLRKPPAEVRDGGPMLAKLRQLPTGMPNVLVVRIDGASAEELNVGGAAAGIRRRADVKDEQFFRRRGLEGTRDFHARFLRLGVTAQSGHDASGFPGETRRAIPAAGCREFGSGWVHDRHRLADGLRPGDPVAGDARPPRRLTRRDCRGARASDA